MSDQLVEPHIGPLQLITSEPKQILTATCASGPTFGCIAWHTAPERPNQEAIYLSKILEAVLSRTQISEGADPDCLLTETGGYISWIIKNPDTELWTINLSAFDNDMRFSSRSSPAHDVANLVTRPYLAQFEGELYVIYLTSDREGHTEIHTYFLRSGRTLHDKLRMRSPNDMIVKSSRDHLVAAVEDKDELVLLMFDGKTWETVANIPKEGSVWPFRFDFALSDTTAMLVMEFEEHQRLGTQAVNLSTGKFASKWAISEYGKFPSIASTHLGWLIGWVGAPSLPLDLQGKDYNSDNSLAYIGALQEVRSEAESEDKADLKSEMEKIWGVSYVSPWAPLWLGVLDDSGKCTKAYGPLGGDLDENFGTQLSFHGDRGILIWRSSERHALEEDYCVLKARELGYSA